MAESFSQSQNIYDFDTQGDSQQIRFVDDDFDGQGGHDFATTQDEVPGTQPYTQEPYTQPGPEVPVDLHDEPAYDGAAGGVVGDSSLSFVEDFGYCAEAEASAPTELPYWRCEFCNIHTPAAVVKCVATGKWFCNHKQQGLPASCIVYHLVRSRHNEVMLHKESPLGEITLECFLTGAKNVFQLGFVPVKEDLVVLLARDVDVNSCLLYTSPSPRDS